MPLPAKVLRIEVCERSGTLLVVLLLAQGVLGVCDLEANTARSFLPATRGQAAQSANIGIQARLLDFVQQPHYHLRT